MALACKVHLTNGFEMRIGIGEEKLNSTADVDVETNWLLPCRILTYSCKTSNMGKWELQENGKKFDCNN